MAILSYILLSITNILHTMRVADWDVMDEWRKLPFRTHGNTNISIHIIDTLCTPVKQSQLTTDPNRWPLTSFFDLSSSELKLLSNKAKNKLRTMKLPMTSVGRKMAKQVDAPFSPSARMQSHSGSIHSPHKMRKIIMNEWKKSLKFHLEERRDTVLR